MKPFTQKGRLRFSGSLNPVDSPVATGLSRSAFRSRAFSLVEVTLALGLISFAMLGILGLLPVGLKTVQQAMVQSGQANIARQVRADLQQVSLASLTGLTAQTNYYSQQGLRVADKTNSYFAASFAVTDPTVAGAASSFNTSAKVVKVTLKYPSTAPANNQKTNTFAILTAGQ